jgi:predicted deacylase
MASQTDSKLDITGVKLSRGERTKLKIPLLELADGSGVELPVMVLRGAEPGPVCYIGSAFHGDEINGVEVVGRLARELDLRDLRGTIILVPAQNPLSLQVQHRYMVGHLLKSPLDQSPADPWVCFPGDPEGNMASLIAHRIHTELMRKADIMVDIHTPTTGGATLLLLFSRRARQVTRLMNRNDSPRPSARILCWPPTTVFTFRARVRMSSWPRMAVWHWVLRSVRVVVLSSL